MSRSPGKSRSRLYSHTHSQGRAPSLSARLFLAAVIALAGAPVLPLLLNHAPVSAQTAAPSTDNPATDDSAEKAPSIADRVSSLADSSYEIREQATRALIEHGEAALPELRKALGSTDLEVRRRAGTLIEEIARNSEREKSREGGRRTFRLPELTDPAFEEAVRRLDALFERVDRIDPPSPDRLRMRMRDLDADLDDRIAELQERMRRSFDRFPGGSIEERLFGGRSMFGREGLFDFERLDLEGLRDSIGEGSARVQIWRDGEPVFDSSRSFDFSEVSPLGIAVESLHPSLRAHLPIPEGQGLLVGDVSAGGLGDRAGLKEHDVLLSIAGTPIIGLSTLRTQLRQQLEKSEKSTEVEILRAGKPRAVTVSLVPVVEAEK